MILQIAVVKVDNLAFAFESYFENTTFAFFDPQNLSR